MAVIKCKMCGGSLAIKQGSSIAECEYCGSVQTVPTADNEKKLGLFERANYLRAQCEFDKAAGLYEAIIADFPEEAEAYWGLLLCKYGIEYVDDPATRKKIPTCHRSGFECVMDDKDLELVMKYGDPLSRRVYLEEAKQIEELRKNIVAVSSREEPYDIFICYKETDDRGQRTLDSVLAQDVYDSLVAEGYRVFFSRITLRDKLGQEYEPYIFAALNSAKVMLVFATDTEYLNAVWVKNEWSRFLQLMAADRSKHLIPCYKRIGIEDMPKEFQRLQSQNLDTLGAKQDLLLGIGKLIQKKRVNAAQSGSSAENMIKRAFMFLGDKDFAKANQYAEKALDADPENGQAYLAKLMAETRTSKVEQLKYCSDVLELNNNYKKIMLFGDPALKKQLESYNNEIKESKKDTIYSAAIRKMNGAKTIADYEDAAQLFGTVARVKDAAWLRRICLEKADECRREEAIRKQQELNERLLRQQREEREREERRKQQEIITRERAEAARIAAEKQLQEQKKLKTRRTIGTVFAVVFFVAAAVFYVLAFSSDEKLIPILAAAAALFAGFMFIALGKYMSVKKAITWFFILAAVLAVALISITSCISFYSSCGRMFSV